MCIVIDANAITSVFCKDSVDHDKYQGVRKWILEGKGCMVVGGKKYKSEITEKITKLRRLFKYLNEQGKIKEMDEHLVDKRTNFYENKFSSQRDFDDPHIMALLDHSGCLIVCTEEKRLSPYLKRGINFSDGKKRKIFNKRTKGNNLFTDENIVKNCSSTCIIKKKVSLDDLITA